MGQPRKKKTDFVLNPPKIGSEYLKYGMDRIEELMVKTDTKSKYLPKTIKLEDLDNAIFDFVQNKDMKLIIDGKDVPVIFLTNERWAEFAKTWQYVDNDKNLATPFITIVRNGDPKEGTRLGNRWTVAQRKRFAYMDVPIFDEGQTVNLRFKIPEPTNVDVTYDIKFFTKYMSDCNEFDETKLKTFASRQAFTFIKGNPMPIIKDNEMPSNSVQDVSGDRMYVKTVTIKLLGFIQDENDFQIVKTSRIPNIGITVKN